MQQKRILITGANGLLGQKLVKKLVDTGTYEVIATGIGASRLSQSSEDDYIWRTMDITRPDDIDRVFAEFRPDTLIHTAAMTQVDDCELDHESCDKLNIEAVAYLVAACQAYGTHMIHLSTDFIFNGKEGPLTEEALPDPINYYGLSKLKAEQLLLKSDIRWAIVRTVLVYGLAQDMSRSNIILWVKESLEDGKSIKVVNDQWRTPTLAEDLADGCILIMQKEATGVFNISGKDFLSPYQMACMTADYFGLDKTLIEEVDSTIFTQPAMRPPKTGFVIKKAEEVLGYSPKSFMDGIGILSKQLKLANS